MENNIDENSRYLHEDKPETTAPAHFGAINYDFLLNDFVFWAVSFFGALPLVIMSFSSQKIQITFFSLFFAAMWAVIFKKLIIRCKSGWINPISAFIFTGFAGIALLFAAYRALPAFLFINGNESLALSYIGFIFPNALFEELTKILPAVIFILLNRRGFAVRDVLTVGVFSGLSFAAFENAGFTIKFLNDTTGMAISGNVREIAQSAYDSTMFSMLRNISVVFNHGVWSGILSYFIAAAFKMKKGGTGVFLLGLFIATFIHGTYNWVSTMETAAAGALSVATFALFYGFILKLDKAD